MSRDLDAAIVSEVQSAQVRTYHLFEGVWPDSVTVRLTDASFPVEYDGNTYTAAGQFLNYTGVEEAADTQVNTLQIQLSGMPTELISIIDTYELTGIPLKIWRAFCDSSWVRVADPVLIFSGYGNGGAISQDDSQIVITLEAVDRMADFERVNGRRTNDAEQKRLFPGDKAFELVPDLVGKVVRW